MVKSNGFVKVRVKREATRLRRTTRDEPPVALQTTRVGAPRSGARARARWRRVSVRGATGAAAATRAEPGVSLAPLARSFAPRLRRGAVRHYIPKGQTRTLV